MIGIFAVILLPHASLILVLWGWLELKSLRWLNAKTDLAASRMMNNAVQRKALVFCTSVLLSLICATMPTNGFATRSTAIQQLMRCVALKRVDVAHSSAQMATCTENFTMMRIKFIVLVSHARMTTTETHVATNWADATHW
jgi:hypothetical protein